MASVRVCLGRVMLGSWDFAPKVVCVGLSALEAYRWRGLSYYVSGHRPWVHQDLTSAVFSLHILPKLKRRVRQQTRALRECVSNLSPSAK